MLDDCDKYIQELRIGIGLLSSILVLIILYATGVMENINNGLVSIYVIFVTFFGLKKMFPYLKCLSQYKRKNF